MSAQPTQVVVPQLEPVVPSPTPHVARLRSAVMVNPRIASGVVAYWLQRGGRDS